MGDLEITLAAPFIHMRSSSLSQMKLVFYYTQDKRWMGLDDAKKLITIGLTAGILTKDEHGEFVLTESLRDEKVPLGFRPTDEIFSAPLPEFTPCPIPWRCRILAPGKNLPTPKQGVIP